MLFSRLRSLNNILSISNRRHMSGSKYAYVRDFELPDQLLPDTFIVFRLDGHHFHRCVFHEAVTKCTGYQRLVLISKDSPTSMVSSSLTTSVPSNSWTKQLRM